MANISPGKFSDIPPSILNTRPALRPPAGVKSNFVNPEGRGHICNAVVTVLFCLTVCLFANRIYTKLFIVRKTGWDDCECASKRVKRIVMKLIFLQSNMHHRVCRNSLAVSTYRIPSLTASQVGSLGMYIATLWSNAQIDPCVSARRFSNLASSGTIRGPVGKHQWDVRKVDTISGNFVTVSLLDHACSDAFFDRLQTGTILIFLSPITLLFTFFFLYLQVFWILKWLWRYIELYHLRDRLRCTSCIVDTKAR